MSDVAPGIRPGYTLWGVPGTVIGETESAGYTSRAQFHRILSGIGPTLAQGRYRLSPETFEGNGFDTLTLPRSPGWKWRTLENTLREISAARVMSMLPSFWQTEPPAFYASRAAEVPFFTVEADNLAVAARAIDLAGVDTVIATPEVARSFNDYLLENGDQPPRNWILIHSTSTTPLTHDDLPPSATVASEVHLFPGVPLLFQCLSHIQTRSGLFHLSDDFALSEVRGGLRVTVKDPESMPVFALELPFELQEKGICTECGRTIYTVC
ncbi:hypothetical protein EXS56_03335 [Candidatus Kaiserbacteria bacterium]|nr:hypothetical protein [Candidatus Kaiserbacteria bacterium]